MKEHHGSSTELLPPAPTNQQALAKTDDPEPSNMLAIIARAANNPAIDVEKMERLLAMQERIVAKQAEEEFNLAMAKAQAEMPRVTRDARNQSTNSSYAKFETLNETVKPIYTQHGFSLSFGSADCPIADHYRITCVVSKGSHSRNYQVDLPRDDIGAKGNPNKTKMHGAGSTFSYGRRYLTMLIFNIAMVNEDDDGNLGRQKKTPGPSSETKELANELWTLLKPIAGPDDKTKSVQERWLSRNDWLWREEILDGAVPEEAPNLAAAKFREAIEKAKAKLCS